MESDDPGAGRIDASVYKDGFETGRFVSVTAADPKAVPNSGVAMQATDGPLAGAPLPMAMSLRLESLTLVKQGAEVEAVLGGLVPGINYYVRVQGTDGETIRVQAPICPADFVNPESK